MKITLIHGDNDIFSRNRFRQIVEAIKKRNWEVVNINLNKSLSEQLVAKTLFSDNSLFVLEKDVDKILAKDLAFLQKNIDELTVNLLLYHKSELTKTFIKKLPQSVKVEYYPVDNKMFKFIEMIYPHNLNNVLETFSEVCKKEPVELIFSLISRQIKDLYWVSLNDNSFDLPKWRLDKLKAQTSKYAPSQLRSLITQLAEIDIQSKTSQINLKRSLDFLFVSNLK